MDIAEMAEAKEAQLRDAALAKQETRAGLRGKSVADSAELCVACNEPIDEARRHILPGVQRCVLCQVILEKFGALYGR